MVEDVVVGPLFVPQFYFGGLLVEFPLFEFAFLKRVRLYLYLHRHLALYENGNRL